MTAGGQLARAVGCRYCSRPIYVALCRDGRWRSFDRARVLAAPAGVWAWRKHEGMEETDVVPGHRLHFCAEHGALGATFAGLPVQPVGTDQAR